MKGIIFNTSQWVAPHCSLEISETGTVLRQAEDAASEHQGTLPSRQREMVTSHLIPGGNALSDPLRLSETRWLGLFRGGIYL